MKISGFRVVILLLVMALLPLAGCLRGPSLVTEAEFRDLLTESDVKEVLGRGDLNIESVFLDNLDDPRLDPAEVRHIDSDYAMAFITNPERTEGISLRVVDFDSRSQAEQSMRRLVVEAQLTPMGNPVGSQSVAVEVGRGGFGSAIVFQKGETLTEMLVRAPEGTEPVLTMNELETLARKVAGKL